MSEPESMTPEERALWEAASPQDRARSEKSLSDLVFEDLMDTSTPDHFDVPGLKPLEQVEEELADPAVRARLAAALNLAVAGEILPEEALRLAADAEALWELEEAAPGRLGVGGSPSNIDKIMQAADAARNRGLRVVFLPGWSTRGANRRQLVVRYIGDHHTAAEVDVDRLLRDGRVDVPGPLCNSGVHLDGTIVIVAAGPANHFGVATVDSSDAHGVEVTGPKPITARGKAAYPNYRETHVWYAVLCDVYGLPADRVRRHAEVCVPSGRKIDRSVDGNVVRADVAAIMAAGPVQEDEDMAKTDAEWIALMKKGAAQALNDLTPKGEQSIVTAFDRLYRETRAQADDQVAVVGAIHAGQAAVLGALRTLNVELSDEAISKIANQTGLTAEVVRAELRKVFADAGTE